MRGQTAKNLRKMAGDTPGTTVTYEKQKAMVERRVIVPGKFNIIPKVEKRKVEAETGALICNKPRRTYLMLKDWYKSRRW